MCSPKRNANSARNEVYENMREVMPGDMVLSFYGTRVQHLAAVTSVAETAPKPEFGSGDEIWSQEGWLVGAGFTPLPHPFRPKTHIDLIQPFLPQKYSLQPSGDGL